jgi:hypothetical protein
MRAMAVSLCTKMLKEACSVSMNGSSRPYLAAPYCTQLPQQRGEASKKAGHSCCQKAVTGIGLVTAGCYRERVCLCSSTHTMHRGPDDTPTWRSTLLLLYVSLVLLLAAAYTCARHAIKHARLGPISMGFCCLSLLLLLSVLSLVLLAN